MSEAQTTQETPDAVERPVFVSYSSKNCEVAAAICAAIEESGVRVWIAPRNVAPGRHYGECIMDAINASKLMIVVFSADSIKSEQVLLEVERAASKGLSIIPFRIENVVPTKSMEYFLSSRHWMNAFAGPVAPHISALAALVEQRAKSGFARQGDGVSASWTPPVWARQGPSRRSVIAASAAGVVGTAIIGWSLLRGTSTPGPPIDESAVAVLPFDNDTGDQALAFLGRSVPDEIGRLLTNLTTFVVRPFGEVQAFLAQNMHAPDPGSGLGVAHTVSGSFAHVPTSIDLSVAVNDVARKQLVWTHSFQADPSALTNMMTLVVDEIGSFLEAKLETDQIRASIGTSNDRAYGLYLHAIGLEQEIKAENNDAAIADLGQAVELDTGFARAYAALAECYVTKFYWNLSGDTGALDQAQEAAGRAMTLRPDLAESHYALAYTYEGKGLRKQAILEYFKSFRANPRYAAAVSNVARFLFYMGAFDRSIAMWDVLARISPTSNKPHIRKAMCHFFMGDLDRATSEIATAERAARGVDELTLCAFVYAWLKDFASADRVLARLTKEAPGAQQLSEIRAWILVEQNKTTEANAAIADILKKNSHDYGILDEIATFYAILGDRDQAVAYLQRAVGNGAPNLAWYRSDFFKALRGDARYDAVIKQLADEYASLKSAIPRVP